MKMKKLDRRGVAALEFCLVCVPIFTLMFTIFDFARYAITMQSLRMLADAGARAEMISCYTGQVIANASPSTCTGSPLTSTQMQTAAPFLYAAGLTPTLVVTSSGTTPHGSLTVTASQPAFAMLMPIWGTALNTPQATSVIPY